MKFIIYTGGERNELFDLLFSDLKRLDNVVIDSSLPKIPSSMTKLWQWHHKYKLNKKRLLPLRGLWNKYTNIDMEQLDNDEEYCLIFNNISIGQYEPTLLNRLKKRNNVHLVLYLLDTLDSFYSREALVAIRNIEFDYVYSYHRSDCDKYGFEYLQAYYSKQELNSVGTDTNDIFFWGSAKGREDKLERIYDKLTKHGIKCDFGMCYVEPSRKRIDGIIYDIELPYKDMLTRMNNSRCVLDLTGNQSKGISLRAYEAIVYNKRLLTDNELVRTMELYDAHNMLVFNDANSIECEFIRNEETVDYAYSNQLSPIEWIKELERKCQKPLV